VLRLCRPRASWLDILIQDLRFTFRTLRRTRLAIVAVLILALGIGAKLPFQRSDTILLRPLPFPAAQQLCELSRKTRKPANRAKPTSADATQDFQQQNRSFQS